MGGNVKLPTGERAEKIVIEKMNSGIFAAYKNDLYIMLNHLNNKFESTIGKKIWIEFDELYKSADLFSGSTRLMFSKPFSQFALYKKTVGDIDIQVPNETMNDLKAFLESNKNSKFGQLRYVGFTNTGMQLNCLFEADPKFKMFSKYIQVDFEGTEFVDNKPTLFSSFGHYSSWTDLKAGIKGFANKYLIRSLIANISKTEAVIVSSKTGKPIKSKPYENIFGFSVDKGLREKIKPNVDKSNNYIMIDGKLSYLKIEPKDAVYETDISKIFETIFCAEPTAHEKYSLFSFIKTLRLMNMYCADSICEATFEDFIELLWAPGAQRLDRDNPSADDEVKTIAYNEFVECFPFLKKHHSKVKNLKSNFYLSYKIS